MTLIQQVIGISIVWQCQLSINSVLRSTSVKIQTGGNNVNKKPQLDKLNDKKTNK